MRWNSSPHIQKKKKHIEIFNDFNWKLRTSFSQASLGTIRLSLILKTKRFSRRTTVCKQWNLKKTHWDHASNLWKKGPSRWYPYIRFKRSLISLYEILCRKVQHCNWKIGTTLRSSKTLRVLNLHASISLAKKCRKICPQHTFKQV